MARSPLTVAFLRDKTGLSILEVLCEGLWVGPLVKVQELDDIGMLLVLWRQNRRRSLQSQTQLE